MTVLNDLDRFHLVMDTIDRLPKTGDKGIYLKQQLKDKLIEHKQYIDKYRQDMPEIRNRKWVNPRVNAKKLINFSSQPQQPQSGALEK